MAVTVPTFDIGGSTAAWDAAVRGSGAANLFAGDKYDPNGDVQVADLDPAAGAVWGNGVDEALTQINRKFAGASQISALDISGTLNVDGVATVGAGSGGATLNLLTASSSTAVINMGAASSGQLRYQDSNDTLIFYTGSSARWQIDGSGNLEANSVGLNICQPSVRAANVYSVAGDFSGAVTVGGDVTLNSASPTLQVGSNAGSPEVNYEKTNGGATTVNFHYGGLGDVNGAKGFLYDASEVFHIRHRDGSAWQNVISIGNVTGGGLGLYGATPIAQQATPTAYTATTVNSFATANDNLEAIETTLAEILAVLDGIGITA